MAKIKIHDLALNEFCTLFFLLSLKIEVYSGGRLVCLRLMLRKESEESNFSWFVSQQVITRILVHICI